MTMFSDEKFARVGSSELGVSSLLEAFWAAGAGVEGGETEEKRAEVRDCIDCIG